LVRWLPIIVAQVPARDPDNAVEALRDEVHGLMADVPRTRLVVYPEYHS